MTRRAAGEADEIKSFLRVVRRALLLVVAYIENRYPDLPGRRYDMVSRDE